MLRKKLLACLIGLGSAQLAVAEEAKKSAIEFDSETLTNGRDFP